MTTYESAAFFRNEYDTEDELAHVSPSGTLAEIVQKRRIPGVDVRDTIQALGQITVYAYGPDRANEEWVNTTANEAAAYVMRTFRSSFGGPDRHRISDAAEKKLALDLAPLVWNALPYTSLHRCAFIGAKTYSPAEVEEILRSEPEFSAWFTE